MPLKELSPFSSKKPVVVPRVFCVLNVANHYFHGGLDHSNLEHLINALMRSPHVVEQSRRFSAMRYKKDPIHATLFSDAIAY